MVRQAHQRPARHPRLERRNQLDGNAAFPGFEEDLRLDAKAEDISTIQLARLERSGDISFIKKEQ